MNRAAITKMKMINDELSLAYGLPVLSNDISDRELNRPGISCAISDFLMTAQKGR